MEVNTLKDLRKSAGLTQVQVAQNIGVSQNRVSRMENGDIRTMSVDTLSRYIEAVGGKLNIVAELPEKSVQMQ